MRIRRTCKKTKMKGNRKKKKKRNWIEVKRTPQAKKERSDVETKK